MRPEREADCSHHSSAGTGSSLGVLS